MQHLETDTGFPGPWWGREGQTESMHVLLIIETGVSHNPGILASEENPALSVQAGGNGNMSSALFG